MKRTIEFLDADRNKVVAECEITERNGYPEFTMSGDYKGEGGQVFDHVSPDGDNQKKLIDIWHKWHLNGMNAGTEKQTAALITTNFTAFREDFRTKLKEAKKINDLIKITDVKELAKRFDMVKTAENGEKSYSPAKVLDHKKKIIIQNQYSYYDSEVFQSILKIPFKNFVKLYDYDDTNLYLKKLGIYEDEGYKYGSGWLHKSLPEDFEDELNDLLDEIESEEEEKSERPVEETDIDLFQDFNEPECALALALMLDLSVNEIGDIVEERNNRWCVQGFDYLAGTDDEMDDAWDEDLDNYLEECVYPDLPENLRNYFDDDAWKRDAKTDGRASALNRWNGEELYQEVNGTYYYAYRQ